MAWPATNIPNRAAGEFIDDPDWDELVDALNFLANRPSCKLRHSAAQATTSGVVLNPIWDTEIWDTDNMHSGSGASITFNTAGLYIITAQLGYAANNVGYRACEIQNSLSQFIAIQWTNAIQGSETHLCASGIVKATVGMTATIRAFQNSGGALNLQTGTHYPTFSATWIGRG